MTYIYDRKKIEQKKDKFLKLYTINKIKIKSKMTI